ncbi:hypothetical protein D0T53_05850 [Dysgonomonas sp. 216]|nr:hypothetical protein [Dysgonomonas sp. 216]
MISKTEILKQDSIINDTLNWVKSEKVDLPPEATIEIKPFKPDPTKAVIYSAIFPGLGQIYNRKYWKLPIVYGGFLGLTYAISWNGGYYNDYSSVYRAIMVENPRNNYQSWLSMAPSSIANMEDPTMITDSQIDWLRSSYKRQRDFYRRNRDLAIIGAVALYAVCMIDAYVDAHLFDFNMSPDLSMRIEPVIMNQTQHSSKSLGVQCSLKF